MADISQELNQIMNASRGEAVRDAIVSAIKKIFAELVLPEEE